MPLQLCCTNLHLLLGSTLPKLTFLRNKFFQSTEKTERVVWVRSHFCLTVSKFLWRGAQICLRVPKIFQMLKTILSHRAEKFVRWITILSHSVESFVRWITILSQCLKFCEVNSIFFKVLVFVKWITFLCHSADHCVKSHTQVFVIFEKFGLWYFLLISPIFYNITKSM